MCTDYFCGRPRSRPTNAKRQWPHRNNVFEPAKFQPTNDASAPGSTSMFKRIAAIAFIFLFTTFAWAVLGTTIFQRTYSSDSSSEVRFASTWGAPQKQLASAATQH